MDKYNYIKNLEDLLKWTNVNGYDLENRIKEEKDRLRNLRESTNMSQADFYESIINDYSKTIAHYMIEDYGKILDKNSLEVLEKCASSKEKCVEFLKSEEFPNRRGNENEPLAEFARRNLGKVYFQKLEHEMDEAEFISFVRKREQSLIHEMFHLVTSNFDEKVDLMINGRNYGATRPGFIFDEAVVEKSAKEFGTRHNLMYHPQVGYIEYVIPLEKFMQRKGIADVSEFYDKKFYDILTDEEIKKYENDELNIIINKELKLDEDLSNIQTNLLYQYKREQVLDGKIQSELPQQESSTNKQLMQQNNFQQQGDKKERIHFDQMSEKDIKKAELLTQKNKTIHEQKQQEKEQQLENKPKQYVLTNNNKPTNNGYVNALILSLIVGFVAGMFSVILYLTIK